jgi:hypothetical protein
MRAFKYILGINGLCALAQAQKTYPNSSLIIQIVGSGDSGREYLLNSHMDLALESL